MSSREGTARDGMTEDSRSILVVDDDDVFRERLLSALGRRGHEVRGARDAAEALDLARGDSPEWAIVDLRMTGPLDGLDLVRGLLAIDPATTVVVLTGYGSIATAVQAMRLGARGYLSKPVDVDRILAELEGKAADSTREEKDPAHHVPSLARVEWEHIQRVLADAHGNISQAARMLGVHRRSLQRKLSKYPVKR
jgi:two-component system response regulator RegA